MDTIDKIMVADGCTVYSEGLINYATRIATGMKANLIIASIINIRDVEAISTVATMGYEVDSDHYISEIKADRLKTFNRILKKNSYPADKIHTIIKVGYPVPELLQIAVAQNAELIVMGIKGRSNLESILMGSVAEKIFRRSPIPILSYRDEKNAQRLKKHSGIS